MRIISWQVEQVVDPLHFLLFNLAQALFGLHAHFVLPDATRQTLFPTNQLPHLPLQPLNLTLPLYQLLLQPTPLLRELLLYQLNSLVVLPVVLLNQPAQLRQRTLLQLALLPRLLQLSLPRTCITTTLPFSSFSWSISFFKIRTWHFFYLCSNSNFS